MRDLIVVGILDGAGHHLVVAGIRKKLAHAVRDVIVEDIVPVLDAIFLGDDDEVAGPGVVTGDLGAEYVRILENQGEDKESDR